MLTAKTTCNEYGNFPMKIQEKYVNHQTGELMRDLYMEMLRLHYLNYGNVVHHTGMSVRGSPLVKPTSPGVCCSSYRPWEQNLSIEVKVSRHIFNYRWCFHVCSFYSSVYFPSFKVF